MDFLIADDDEASSLYLELALRLMQHTAVSVQSGAEVLAMLSDFSFDAVMLDIEMVPMNGIETLSAIRSNPKFQTLPVYAITAHTDGPEMELIRQAGFAGWLTKPVSPEDLRAALAGKSCSPTAKVSSSAALVDAEVFDQYEQLLRGAGISVAAELNRTLKGVADWMSAAPECSRESREAAHRLAGSCAVIGASALRAWLKELERLAAMTAELNLWMQSLEKGKPLLDETEQAYRALLNGSAAASAS